MGPYGHTEKDKDNNYVKIERMHESIDVKFNKKKSILDFQLNRSITGHI